MRGRYFYLKLRKTSLIESYVLLSRNITAHRFMHLISMRFINVTLCHLVKLRKLFKWR